VQTDTKGAVAIVGDRAPTGLHLVRSYSPFDHSRRKESLARMDGRWCKQRHRLRNRCSNRAIWIHTREPILHCALFLQRVELAWPARADKVAADTVQALAVDELLDLPG
jgi:hypothetical protein